MVVGAVQNPTTNNIALLSHVRGIFPANLGDMGTLGVSPGQGCLICPQEFGDIFTKANLTGFWGKTGVF
jgi:hypothetical protein